MVIFAQIHGEAFMIKSSAVVYNNSYEFQYKPCFTRRYNYLWALINVISELKSSLPVAAPLEALLSNKAVVVDLSKCLDKNIADLPFGTLLYVIRFHKQPVS